MVIVFLEKWLTFFVFSKALANNIFQIPTSFFSVKWSKKEQKKIGTSLAVQWLGLCASPAGGKDLIPD